MTMGRGVKGERRGEEEKEGGKEGNEGPVKSVKLGPAR